MTESDPATTGRVLVFTDLDGTLLSHDGYDWSAAEAAVTELSRRRIPLVLTSSKTRAEIETWRARLGIRDPFISENGGGLYVPLGTAPVPLARAVWSAPYHCVQLGASYARLRGCLRLLSKELGVRLRGFGDMSVLEIGRLTGLSGQESALAKEREYDEPFVPRRPLSVEEEAKLEESAEKFGLRITRGGRFHHLVGHASKGTAARLLISAYETNTQSVLSVGLGDGPNDLELLRAVDRPVIVARPDGTHAPELRDALPRARRTSGIGPAGFREAIFDILSDL